MKRLIFLLAVLTAASLTAAAGQNQKPSQKPDGEALYQERCAVCHGSGTRAPEIDVLRQLSRQSILRALETGKMKAEGAQLTAEQRSAIAQFLSSTRIISTPQRGGFCVARRKPVFNDPGWIGWGVDTANSRYEPRKVAVLRPSDVGQLKLKWAFGFPGASASYGQPTVYGGRVYEGSEDGTVYSLDAKTGCTYWTFKAHDTVKTAVAAGFGGRIVYFGDVNGNVYAVNAASGKQVWKEHPEAHPVSRITGSPVFFKGRLYVPVSSGEEGSAIDPKYPCCTFRGSVVALDGKTGAKIWQAYTIPETPHPTGRRNSAGTPMWGPSGASVWSSPTIDPAHHVIYVATGNSYSAPPDPHTDAIIAFNMESGKMLWSRQLTANDLWNIACVAPDKANCPQNPGGDFDFGAPPILRSLPDGRRVLIAAQKSGVVYGLDPDDEGKVLWESRIGKGGALGGIEWGGAAGPKRAFFPLSDWNGDDPNAGGGLFALQIATGERAWYAPPAKPACAKEAGCSAAQMAPVTAIPGVVFSGSEDGHLRAYDARTGKVLWDFDSLQKFQTVNQVAAQGGSMNGAGPAIVDGMVYVTAGYTNGVAGNVLLAFSAGGQ
ncbi:MAG TPA: PQQ-binding-like beta-propeller repeat protein [Terriglobia bacterium]|nr:PQQ-binding-like beta-propeller repeat protein [Terriglobia bacterium]